MTGSLGNEPVCDYKTTTVSAQFDSLTGLANHRFWCSTNEGVGQTCPSADLCRMMYEYMTTLKKFCTEELPPGLVDVSWASCKEGALDTP